MKPKPMPFVLVEDDRRRHPQTFVVVVRATYGQHDEPGCPRSFAATNDTLGCGKTRATAAGALRELIENNGRTLVSTTAVNVAELHPQPFNPDEYPSQRRFDR